MKARVLGSGWVTSGGWGQGGSDALFGLDGGRLPELTRKDLFADPYPRFGRLDPFSRLGLSAIALALADAGIASWQEKRPIGLVADSRYGCLATDFDYFRALLPEEGGLASPNLFAYTLPNTLLGEAAIRFGLTGPGFVQSSGEGSPFAALEVALELLCDGDAPAVVAGFCELPPLSAGGRSEPDRAGAAFLVLAPVEEDSAAGPRLTYDGTWRVDDRMVTDWPGLIAACRQPAGSEFCNKRKEPS
ncbi:hypothetical protein JCM30471_06310 [Desulfuromonas carbonis]|uniref:beta-ketoacyl synthase N-terminal-like domain-containing protein n=1 Tax=Desulfuromonas sp. DDH964 TaxID=1823759 RepID=UPI00078D74A8|nr:beta-ketoacyl synthase N-terminal-like domain-containing protein [Desulfuromonas sp. DDH964]AMV72129.1 hypothetical protein DBW_1772 [Desulfuromonas sp. DDH964]